MGQSDCRNWIPGGYSWPGFISGIGAATGLVCLGGAGWGIATGSFHGLLPDCGRAFELITASVFLACTFLLLAGVALLVRRRRAGVFLCKTWAWGMFAWVVCDAAMRVIVAEWVGGAATLTGDTIVVDEGHWVSGLLLRVALFTLGLPGFLLFWFGRREIQEEVQSWM